MRREQVVERFLSLRQHQQGGRRAPHKPLLVLIALGRIATAGSSSVTWFEARQSLGDLLAEFGPMSKTSRAQSAAYPFTRLRSDGVWVLDVDVPMDNPGPLNSGDVTGRLESQLEARLKADPQLLSQVARDLVESNFPATVAPELLTAVGLDPDAVLRPSGSLPAPAAALRRRNADWRGQVLQAWDRRCAFCGYDGQVGGATAGLEAAHVRWFAFDGPDALDNGLALCVLHHKLFDFGALGLTSDLRIRVSENYSARTSAGRAVYDLHDQPLQETRPGTITPSREHTDWHTREVFKGAALVS
jgi:putative restriction endonuclease